MQDRPNSVELAEAIRGFLENEIIPLIDDPRLRFRTLVAMNGLTILTREITHEQNFLTQEHGRLSELLQKEAVLPVSLAQLKQTVLELNRELVQRIREGTPPPGTLEVVKLNTADKLKIASPRYLERYRT